MKLIGECYFSTKIENNVFTGNTALYGGAIYSGSPFSNLIMLNNIYTKNSAINGGAIYKVAPGKRVYIPSLNIN